MAKIYNEVVIDMNPESPTFEETIYEDSYDGEIGMFAWTVDLNSGKKYYLYDYSGDGKLDTYFGLDVDGKSQVSSPIPGTSGGWNVRHNHTFSEQQTADVARGGINGKWKAEPQGGWNDDRGTLGAGDSTEIHQKSLDAQDAGGDGADGADGGIDTDYGAPNITKDDFFDPTGGRLGFNAVVNMLSQKLDIPASRKGVLEERVNDFLPSLQAIDTEELGFLREQYGAVDDPTTPDVDESAELSFADSLAGGQAGLQLGAAQTQLEGAEATKQQDMYGLQQGAGKLGGAMRSVYSGSAAGLRGAAAGQQAIQQQFDATQAQFGRAEDTFGRAEDAYGLAEREAGLKAKQGVYDLQKKQFDEGKFEEFISSLADV